MDTAMRLRRTSIRVRVFLLVLIPLLALIGVYGFAVAGQLGTAVGLSNAGRVAGATITPTSKLLVALNAERSLAVGYLGTGSGSLLTEYRGQAAATEQALRVLEDISGSGPVTANASPLEKDAAAGFLAAAKALPALRSEVADRSVSSSSVITQYSAIVSDGIQVIGQSLQETYVSQSLAATSREEVNLYESEMLVLQENDVYTAAVLAGRLSAAAQMSFGQLVSVRRYLVQEAVPQLDPEASGLYQRYVPSSLSLALAHLEDQVTQAPADAKPPVPLAAWQAAVKAYATNLEVMLTQGPNWIQSQVTASARSALVTLIAAAILGLLAVIASVVFSAVMGRRLLRRLADLRESALTLAHDQLPSLMARLRRGERVDVDAEAPPAKSSVDELDQVQEAFTVVHRAAVAAAVDESNLRRGVNDVFRNLARRSQLLLQRQLALLDGMERRAEEPDQLADLFRIDHLTTRMRRHAEGLIILSGESTGRNWREPVPLFDVVRAAVAEVEDYTRVNIEFRVKSALVGRAVADVIHLLAELIENATAFSPPDARVTIAGHLVGHGFAVEVQDLGLGLPDGQLKEINRDLASPPDFDLSRSDRLGLFIAGRLAARHGITVTLRQSAYGGVIAVVVIPGQLVVTEGAELGGAGGGDGLPQRSASRAALYRGTADASVELAPAAHAPQPSWWTRQKVTGKHAGGAAQERSADGGGPSDSGSPRPDGVYGAP
jgi:signal transduction histidine kinase